MGLILGIDGGGSKTECVLADETGVTLARAAGPGANLHRVSKSELRATLGYCLEQLQRATSLRTLAGQVVCAGFAGAADAQACARAREVLAELLQPRFLHVVGDMEVALEAAVGAGPGVVLIAGTGSIAYGRNALGQLARAGGLGPEQSDEGSGYDIGRRAVEAVESTPTASTLAEAVRAARLSDSPSPTELAALVPAVVSASRRGDPVARAILEHAADALAALALAVLTELGLQESEVRVATSGGVFAESEEVLAGVRTRLQAAAPRVQVALLETTPAEGAVRLAQRLWLEEQARK